MKSAGRLRVVLAATSFVACALTTTAQPARADDASACAASYTETQKLRKQGKLRAARENALVCVAPTCPGFIQSDCATWLAEIEQQTPTIVVAAIGPDGRDTANVAIREGGAILAPSLDGRPLALDPGQHELEFLHAGSAAVKQTILVREGEKNRRVEVSFQVGSSAALTQPPPGGGPPLPPPRERSHALAIAGGVIAGLGVASVGAFIGLGVTGQNDFDELDETCGARAPAGARGTCTEDQIDPVKTQLTVADVFLGVGAGLTAIGLTLVIVDVATPSTAEAASIALGPGSISATFRF